MRLFSYDEVISCEILRDVDRTVYADTTSSRERNTVYVNTSISTSDKINRLAVKLALRNTSDSSYTFELIKPGSVCPDEKMYQSFATEICDTINAAIHL